MDILSVLKQEHRAVAGLIDQVQQCESDDPQLDELGKEIEQALTVHAELEEKLFYPELRDRAEESDERVDVFEAYTEHEVVKHLIALLKSGRKRDELFKAELQVLGESVKHHVKEEESTIFALARELLSRDELDELGERFEAGKARLMSRASANGRRTGSRKKSGPKRSGRAKKTSRSR
ncbi:MAG: hemerythrin domain-containing protein [Candidatus Eremiobacteraeota bacterium]|nr:hemerythrin domain-containing protein [Candidatus Eremiobacteraeota bacterium]MBV9056209.1 hemerythrin domain-containing protein [Candidatus Eremiobacteraeota bacterium]MBV9700107.1 hemerythrin domain-containing protein [Candidatus Eremiobacteraeota bacterium]